MNLSDVVNSPLMGIAKKKLKSLGAKFLTIDTSSDDWKLEMYSSVQYVINSDVLEEIKIISPEAYEKIKKCNG